jgi:Asp-tRNA(Asn)/Glu-tRNA(Gln) amidotransferase C subunit
VLEGKSPREVFYRERSEPTHIDPKHLGLLCLRTSRARKISRCEFYDSELDVAYTADWMHQPKISGTRAFARRDPQDPERAWIFREDDGSLIGVAERKPEVHPLAETQGTEEEQEELQRQIEQQRKYVSKLEDIETEIEENQPSEEQLDEWYDAYLEAREEERREKGDYDEADELDAYDPEPHEVAAEWEEQAQQQAEAGSDEVPYDPESVQAEDEDDDSIDPNDLRIWPDE